MTLTPYIHFEGNAEEALKFYSKALGGEIAGMQRYGDSPMQSDEDYKQKIMHSRLKFGDNIIMISDTFKGNKISKAGNIQLSIDLKENEKIDELFSKMAEGGKITMPLQDTFWGARFGMLQDKFGIGWMFNQEKKK